MYNSGVHLRHPWNHANSGWTGSTDPLRCAKKKPGRCKASTRQGLLVSTAEIDGVAQVDTSAECWRKDHLCFRNDQLFYLISSGWQSRIWECSRFTESVEISSWNDFCPKWHLTDLILSVPSVRSHLPRRLTDGGSPPGTAISLSQKPPSEIPKGAHRHLR